MSLLMAIEPWPRQQQATSLGDFCVLNQHPSCGTRCCATGGAQHAKEHGIVWSAQARTLWSPARARLNSSGQPLSCAVCSLLCSVRAMTHGTGAHWRTRSLALKKINHVPSLAASQPAMSWGRPSPNIQSSIGSQAKIVPCLGRHAPPPCLLPDRLGRSHRGRDGDGSAWWLLGSQEVFRSHLDHECSMLSTGVAQARRM